MSKLRRPLNVIHGNDRFTKFNKARGNPPPPRQHVVYGAPGYYLNYGYVASDYGYYNGYNNNGYYRPYGYGW